MCCATAVAVAHEHTRSPAHYVVGLLFPRQHSRDIPVKLCCLGVIKLGLLLANNLIDRLTVD